MGQLRLTALPGRPSFSVVLLALCGGLFVVVSNLTPITSNDFWLQLAVGDMIRDTGEIPRTILFSFTESRDSPFFAHEWIPSVGFSLLHGLGGYEGMIVAKAVLALCLYGLLVLLGLQLTRDTVYALALAALAMLALNYRILMRPETFAFLLFCVELNLLEAFRRTRHPSWIAGLIALAPVWANSHASFVLAAGIPWLYLAGQLLGERYVRSSLPLLLAPPAFLALSLLNPYGFALVEHLVLHSVEAGVREHVLEWMPPFHPAFSGYRFVPIYLGYGVLAVAAAALCAWRRNVVPALLVAVFGYMSLDAMRFVAWFVLAGSVALFAAPLPPLRSPLLRTASALAVAAALLAGVAIVFTLGNVRARTPGFEFAAPLSREAIQFIDESGVEGNVLNNYNMGAQLAYHFYPRLRISIDSRYDAYGEAYYRAMLRVTGRNFSDLGPPIELLRFLEVHDVQLIVTNEYNIANLNSAGHAKALHEAGWRLVYADPRANILRRGN